MEGTTGLAARAGERGGGTVAEGSGSGAGVTLSGGDGFVSEVG